MKRLSLLFLLLCYTSLQAQAVTVGDAIPQQAVELAKQTIVAAQPKVLKLAVGEFEVIEPAKNMQNVPMLQLPSKSPIFKMLVIPAKQSHSVTGIRRGDKVTTDYFFPAKDYAWSIVTGKKQGETTIMLIGNGPDKDHPPVQIDSIAVTVGDPLPPIPDPDVPLPVNDPLVTAYLADIKAGKGLKEDVDNYASLYSMYATQVRNGSTLKTVGDLYKAMNTAIDTLLGEDIEKTLPSLRKAVGKELSAKIPTNPSLSISDFKTQIADEFSSIAKRLQGSK